MATYHEKRSIYGNMSSQRRLESSIKMLRFIINAIKTSPTLWYLNSQCMGIFN